MRQRSTGVQRAATVEFDHVTKFYDLSASKAGAPGAVNGLSLQIPAGRICVLVGPSGCGKTTSLKMVNRLIEPTSGRILIDGIDAATWDVTELRRSFGYVIQQTGLFPHQTIEENVATVPRLLGWPKARPRDRIAAPPAGSRRAPAAAQCGTMRPGPAKEMAPDLMLWARSHPDGPARAKVTT